MRYQVSENRTGELTIAESDTVRSVLENIRVLLMTRKGTCPHYRDFGLAQKWLDKPSNVARPMMYSEIKEALEEFEPRAELVSVTFSEDADTPGRLIPIVEVEISNE